MVAGSAHGDKMPPGIPAGHGYSLGAVVRDERGGLHIRITPRKWSEKNASFRPDVDNVPDGQGYSDHALGLSHSAAAVIASSTPKQAAPVAVQAVPNEPVSVFISGAPEDDALRLELQKHLVQLRRSKKAVFTNSHEVPPGPTRPRGSPSRWARHGSSCS